MSGTFETVTSADGTAIALERAGDGPVIVLVGGAFNDRSTVRALGAELAAAGFTAIGYDRRGRGASGDSPGYAVQREVEDIAAVVGHASDGQAGGAARLFGHSSGAVLVLEAAAAGLPVSRVAAYEPPFIIGDSRPRPAADLPDRIRKLVEEGNRDDAAALFLTEGTAAPPQVVAGMRASDSWGWFSGLAHTLPYDSLICGPGNALEAGRLAAISVPTLAIGGSASPPWLSGGARAVAEAVAGARYETLDGQDHGVLNQPATLRPLLTSFFS